MIESININTTSVNKQGSKKYPYLKPPKNVRQIGQVDSTKKIYVEDYVMTYMKQIAMKNYGNYQVAILLGSFAQSEEGEHIYIRAAVEVEDIQFDEEKIFSNEAWNGIYEDIKNYFTEVEIVGWYITRPGLILELDDKIKKIHVDNFAGQDKTLMMYDSIEREDAFYIYDENQLKKQNGYYIYYEKNEPMQNYMVEHKEQSSNEAEYEDVTTREIRNVLSKKKEENPDKNSIPLLYTVSTLLAVVVLVIAAALMANLDKISSMEDAIHTISNNMNGSKNEQSVAVQDPSPSPQATNDEQSNGPTVVEVMEGNVSPINDGSPKPSDVTLDPAAVTPDPAAVTPDPATVTPDPAAVTPDPAVVTPDPAVSTPVPAEASAEPVVTNKPDDTKESTTKKVDYYTVKKGDTLVSISKDIYNSIKRVKDIMAANNIKDQDYIYIGQKLILP